METPFCTLVLSACFSIASSHGAVLAYDEAVDGEFSADHLNPTPIGLALAPAENTVNGTISSLASIDRDYFTVSVPIGLQWTELSLRAYDTTEDMSFIAFVGGSAAPDPGTVAGGDLTGATLFGGADVGSDLLTSLNGGLGSVGFSVPLAAGDYTIWVQETGSFDIGYSLEFVTELVPEPSSGSLAVLAGLGFVLRRRRA